MTLLPIVERELRVASRRKGTYGMRVKIAAAAALAFAVCFVGSLTVAPLPFGKALFWGLSGLCFVYSLFSGRLMTADCLSSEKREGTLGLLFLTDLKGYDVVLGKLAATSLDGFYRMLAIVPILAVPLLMGGLTSAEFWRMVLVLVDTFLFSLSIGLCASAIHREQQKAMGMNLALLLWLAAVPPAIGGGLAASVPGFKIGQSLFYTCPVYAFWECSDSNYGGTPRDFWWCVGVIFLLTSLLLLLACRIAPRSWQDNPGSARKRGEKNERRRRWWRDGSLKSANSFRERLLAHNAYFWLAARPHLKSTYVWLAMAMMGCLWLVAVLATGSVVVEAGFIFALILNVLLKLWITTESSRQLADDKKSGAFELLLSTPLTVDDVLRGQRLALRRQFLMPLLVAAAMELLLLASTGRGGTRIMGWLWPAAVAMFVADATALGWVGMLAGLRSKTHGRATTKAAACILVLPWLLFGGADFAIRAWHFLFARRIWNPNGMFDLRCWFAVGILADIFFVAQARRKLRTSFRQLAFEPPAAKRRFAWLRDWRAGTPEQRAALQAKVHRKAAVVTVLLAILGAAALYDIYASRANLPKPVLISVGRSESHIKVVGTQEGIFLILPDGTLWTWGRRDVIAPPRRLGTNLDWVQVGSGNIPVGLRGNGTLWTWTGDTETPVQFGSESNWAEACFSFGWSVARKRDGTLWRRTNGFNLPLFTNRSDIGQVGSDRDWKALMPGNGTILGLRSNGTVWALGSVYYFSKGVWNSTNYPVPSQLCQESNWVDFYGNANEHGARNQSNEFWSFAMPFSGAPGPLAPVTTMSQLMSSNVMAIAFGPCFFTNWTYARYEVRSNGTLWATRWTWRVSPARALSSPERVSARSDWASVWSVDQTMLGLTSDGTLWTWGFDHGREPGWVEVFTQRIALSRRVIGFMFGERNQPDLQFSWYQYPGQKEPRPLLRLMGTNSLAPP